MSKKQLIKIRFRLPTIGKVRAVAKSLFLRAYCLAILCVLIWSGWLASAYLINSVFRPTHIPASLLEWQGRVDVAALRQENVTGITGAAGRAPLGHYHGVERWFQPDSGNTCTTSGCHEPLPHSQRMRIPAFANFHTTFLDCRMCHTDIHNSAGKSAPVAWLSMATGKPQEMPPILLLLRYLENQQDEIVNNPAAADPNITGLLKRTVSESGDNGILAALLAQLQNSAPGGPVWRTAVQQLAMELPLHARGEYAAKIGPVDARDSSTDAARTLASLTKQFLAETNDLQRGAIKNKLHSPLLKEPVSCLACHGNQPATLDFDALGYSPRRSAILHDLPLAHRMQGIRQGEEFVLPNILEAK